MYGCENRISYLFLVCGQVRGYHGKPKTNNSGSTGVLVDQSGEILLLYYLQGYNQPRYITIRYNAIIVNLLIFKLPYFSITINLPKEGYLYEGILERA